MILRKQLNGLVRALRGIKRALFPHLKLYRYPHLERLVSYIASKSTVPYAENVLGHNMYLDDKDTLRLSITKIYEPVETKLFQHEVHEGDVVLDIGGNIGYYTLLFARKVGVQGHVYTFEPDITNFGLASRNVKINGYTNVTLVNKAVSDRTGVARLYLSEENKGDHRMYDSQDGRRYVEISTVSLDDYFKDLKQEIAFIKMDIQGAEYHALLGMKGLLEKSTHVVIASEFWPGGMARFGGPDDPLKYLQLLSDLGFVLYHLDEKTENIIPIEPKDFPSFLALHPPESDTFTTVICRKNSHRPS